MSEVVRNLASVVAFDVAGDSARNEAYRIGPTVGLAALHQVNALITTLGDRMFTMAAGFKLGFSSSFSALGAAVEFAATQARAQLFDRMGLNSAEVVVGAIGDDYRIH